MVMPSVVNMAAQTFINHFCLITSIYGDFKRLSDHWLIQSSTRSLGNSSLCRILTGNNKKKKTHDDADFYNYEELGGLRNRKIYARVKKHYMPEVAEFYDNSSPSTIDRWLLTTLLQSNGYLYAEPHFPHTHDNWYANLLSSWTH